MALRDELRAAGAEMIATCLLVFFGVGSVCGAIRSGQPVQPINYAVSFGFCITALAYSIADISGGHINPAITASFMLTGNISIFRGVLYIVAQLIGGFIGGGLLCGCTGEWGRGYDNVEKKNDEPDQLLFRHLHDRR